MKGGSPNHSSGRTIYTAYIGERKDVEDEQVEVPILYKNNS